MTSYMLVENPSQQRPFFTRGKRGHKRMGFREFREFLDWQEERDKKRKDENKPKDQPKGNFNFLERFTMWMMFGPILGSLWIVASVKSLEWAWTTIRSIAH